MDDQTNVQPILFGGRAPSFYWKTLFFPIALAVIINLLMFLDGRSGYFLWLVNGLLFAYEVFALMFQNRGSVKECSYVGAITGFIMGASSGITRFALAKYFYLFFQIICEAFLWLLVGMIFSGVIAFFSQKYRVYRIQSRKERK